MGKRITVWLFRYWCVSQWSLLGISVTTFSSFHSNKNHHKCIWNFGSKRSNKLFSLASCSSSSPPPLSLASSSNLALTAYSWFQTLFRMLNSTNANTDLWRTLLLALFHCETVCLILYLTCLIHNQTTRTTTSISWLVNLFRNLLWGMVTTVFLKPIYIKAFRTSHLHVHQLKTPKWPLPFPSIRWDHKKLISWHFCSLKKSFLRKICSISVQSGDAF